MAKIDLDPKFQKFVEDQLANGRFETANEVVEAALRLLEEHQAARAQALAEVKRKIRESLDDPRPTIPAEEVFAKIRAKLDRIRTGVDDA